MVSLFTSQTPAVSGNDGAPGITTATSLMFAVAGVISHVRFWAANDTLSGTWTGAVWQVTSDDGGGSGTGTLLGSKAVSAAGITPNAWNLIELDTPVPVVPGVLYRIGLHTPAWYVATNGFFNSPLVNGDITAPENGSDPIGLGTLRQGTFIVNAAIQYPTQVGLTASYFIDVDFIPDGSTPAEGTSDVGLDFSVSATGGADAEGSAALGIGLAVAASGTARAQGAVALTLGLAPAAAGERASQGAVALGLGLAVAASGERAARGAVALGLNLAVTASGSNGEAGCPVSPWPWTPRVLTGYPETARPVKSFPGGECS